MELDHGHVRDIRRVTWVGLIANLALSGVKFLGGFFGNSHAVVADAVHSLSDCATDLAILIGVHFWSAPPDANHPHGHRRFETLITTGIGVALAAVALGVGWDAIQGLGEPRGGSPSTPALVAAALSIVVKEALYRWTVIVGRRVHSSALIANAWHHRSDAISSIPAVLAVAVALVRPDWAFVDFAGALVVSIFILQAAWKILKPALDQLVDVGAPPEVLDRVQAIVLATPGVLHVHSVRTRYLGGGVAADLCVHVAPEITVYEGHEISERVRDRLLAEGPEIVDVVVHIEPDLGPEDREDEA